MKIVTTSGDIAIRNSQTDLLSLKSVSGDVEVDDTKSTSSVNVKAVSGDIDISGSDAPSWRLTTVSGDIKVKTTKGEVDASSVSGRTKVSQ